MFAASQIMEHYPELRLRKKEDRRLTAGHLWAFSNELIEVPKDIPAGTVVTLMRESDNAPIGHAFYHPHSLIAARLLTRDIRESIDEDFFRRRIVQAAAKRDLLLTRRNAARLVHGESDFLPGLIVDRFGDILSFQITSAGFEVRKAMLVSVLESLFHPRAIVEKNNSNLRKLEGLPLIEQVVLGSDTHVQIHDSAGTKFDIDVLTGQKTGFFLDQMENRARVRDFIRPNARVLDLFSNEGGFALNAALAGASSVIAVDASQSALGKLAANASLNGVQERVTTEAADCFDYLQNSSDEFDLIILDPPALAKSKKDLATARKGYLALNTNAIRRLRTGGVLVSASCSHHVSREMLLDILYDAGIRSRRAVTILEERGAGIDHPVLVAMPETSYLKLFILGID
jgi:23S rRNA (cytosine1962-C5)-methyltransferase